MALSQIYSAVAGDTITAARWNNEFGNIYANGTDIAFPVTKAVSFAGFTITLDAAGVSTLTSTASTGYLFTVGSKAGAPSANGTLGTFTASTFTDTSTAGSGIASLMTGLSVRRPTLAAANTLVTTTKAASVYIENAPLAGANETLTNSYALLVDDGKVQFDGDLQVEGTTTFNGPIIATNDDPYLLTNVRLNVTVAGNALTVALVTDANTNATSANPIRVRFRNATLATGGTSSVSITSALSMTVSSGSTLGTVSGSAHRIYVGLLNNSGTAELFVYNPLSGANLKGLHEAQLLTTTAEGGSGAADSAQVPYSTTARTSKAFRIIGFFESTQATAGTWVTSVSTTQELQPWMPRTGAVLASAIATNGTSSGALTLNLTIDDTPSNSANGNQVVSVSYTPVSTINVIEIDAQVAGIVAQGDTPPIAVTTALFTDISASAIVTDIACSSSVAGIIARGCSRLKARLATLGAMTSAQVRIGGSNSSGTNTYAFNGASTASDEGATMNSYISVTEIMV